MIDMNRPVEAVRKSDGKVVPLGMPTATTAGNGDVPRFRTKKGPCPNTSNDLWYIDGRDYCHHNAWTIRNVNPAITVGTKMRCARVCRVTGTVAAFTSDGGFIIQRDGSKQLWLIEKGSFRDPDGDRWEVVPTPVEATVYRNIYADGTIGETGHEKLLAAEYGSKYGKVRVGILTQRLRGDEVIGATALPTTPQLRTRDNPGGYNPYV